MSYTVSPHEDSWDAHHERHSSPPSRLLAVLGGALLLVLGIAIGGFMARSDSRLTVGGLEAEMTALRAEINMLNLQATQAQSSHLVMEQLLTSQQELVSREQRLAQTAASRLTFLGQVIEMTNSNRQACLNELQQFRRLPTGVPIEQVIRFAESVFDTQSQILRSLAVGRQAPSTKTLDLKTSLSLAASPTSQAVSTMPDSIRTVEASRISTKTVVGLPVVPTRADERGGTIRTRSSKPKHTEPAVSAVTRSRGVFFTPPQRRPGGLTFITPRRPSRVASRQGSGMAFTDDAGPIEGPTLR